MALLYSSKVENISKRRSSFKTLTFPRVITFVKKLGVVAFAKKVPTTHALDCNLYVKYARVVFEKSQEVSKDVQTIKVLAFQRPRNFKEKNGRRHVCKAAFQNRLFGFKPKIWDI